MTRQRFIKLIMAQGVSRNDAAELAAQAMSQGIPYDKAYHAYMSIPKVFDSLRNVAEAVQKIANAACAGVKAFAEAFCAAFKET